jgi:hypothetical protein
MKNNSRTFLVPPAPNFVLREIQLEVAQLVGKVDMVLFPGAGTLSEDHYLENLHKHAIK